jgi:hypothetical protein
MNTKALIIALAAMGVSTSAIGQNLVVNGSFEDPADGSLPAGCVDKGSWFYCPSNLVPGWTVEKLLVDELYNLEMQTQPTLGVTPPDGSQYAELATHPDSDSRVVISQDIDVDFCPYDSYTLSFWAREREPDDILEVVIDGQTYTPDISGTFTEFTYPVIPSSGTISIAFKEIGPAQTLGSLLDDVQLVADEDFTNCVAIDIKFCSDPNAFNCKKKGVLPVTIFGSGSLPDIENDLNIYSLNLCNAETGSCTDMAVVDYSVYDRGDPTLPGEIGASYCGNRDCLEYDLVAPYECVAYDQEYLNQDGYVDLDVAFDVAAVKDILTLDGDTETDFCDAEKGDISAALYIEGFRSDGETLIGSIPVESVGVDQLLKTNK